MSEQQKVQALIGQAPDMMSQSVALAVLRQFDGDVGKAAHSLREMEKEYPQFDSLESMEPDQSAVAEQEELLRRFKQEREERVRQEAAERARVERERANAEEQERIRMIREAEAQQVERLALLEKKREEMVRRQREMEAQEEHLMAVMRAEKERLEREKKGVQEEGKHKATATVAIKELTSSILENRKAQTEVVIRKEVEEQLRAEAEKERESLRKALADLEGHHATAMAKAEAAELRSKTQAEEMQKLERQMEERFASRIQELREAMEKQAVKNATNGATPRATICWSSAEKDSDVQTVQIEEMISALTAAGLHDAEIRKVDVVHDPELAVFVREQLKTLSLPVAYPVVSVVGRTVGGVAQLSAAVSDGSFQSLLDGTAQEAVESEAAALADGTGEIVGEGVLDKCLNAAEYVASGIGSLLYLPVNIITYPFRGGSGQLPKGPNDVDFDVLHTNWYWRNLRRKFRFYDAEFVRIHPVHNDIRGRHAYTAIESVVFHSDTNMVLRYNDGSSPDFLQASESDCQAIIRTIELKMGAKLTVWRAEELNTL